VGSPGGLFDGELVGVAEAEVCEGWEGVLLGSDDDELGVGEVEEARGEALEVGGGDGLDHGGVAAVVVVAEAVELVEGHGDGACAVALELDVVVAEEVDAGAVDLGVVDGLVAEARDLAQEAGGGLFEGLGGGGDVEGEVAGVEARDGPGGDGVGQGLAVAELEEEASALAGEDGGEDLQGVSVGVVEAEAGEGEEEVRLLLGERGGPEAARGGTRVAVAARRGCRGRRRARAGR
jgi:hypothetical protein